ncbi:contractile injection system protein, VgrG/Pvc8 family [Streptomyces sp. NPDC050658]|uniref:contractile injection system protein, VgrG/Pvc8 family n=1 Tax=unclassified Streptomyces TaxID=2593676 RepID=UPI003442F11A
MASTRMLIEIDGSEPDRDALDALIEVRAEEATDEADAAVVTVRVDPDASGGWPSLLDPLVTPRTPLTVRLERDGRSYRFEGYSAEALWDLDAEGRSTLTVKAIDRTIDLDREEKAVAWPGQRDSAIAETIFTEHKLRAEVAPTPPGFDNDVHTVMQRGTDWSFVRELAARWGYVTYLEADDSGAVTGHFHPPEPLAEPQGELALGFGDDARRARVRVDLLAGRRVLARRMPPLAAAPVVADAAGDDEAMAGVSLAAQVTELLAPQDAVGEVDARQTATGRARSSAYGVTLTADLDTDRTGLLLRARRTVLVAGLGPVLSGSYLVDRVRHVVTLEAHRQEVTLRRNALGAAGLGLGGLP